MKKMLVQFTVVLFLGACGQQASDPVPETVETSAPELSIYAAALENPARPEADVARDATRRPAEVLEFFAITPNTTVLELFAGGGYYTELLAHVVGENGKVVAHMNTPLVKFGGDEFTARHADNRLPNTEVLMAENNELMLDSDQFDAITIVLNYHDLYWASDDYGWVAFDVPKFLAEIHKGLKPGGTLGIVDHFAASGSSHALIATLSLPSSRVRVSCSTVKAMCCAIWMMTTAKVSSIPRYAAILIDLCCASKSRNEQTLRNVQSCSHFYPVADPVFCGRQHMVESVAKH